MLLIEWIPARWRCECKTKQKLWSVVPPCPVTLKLQPLSLVRDTLKRVLSFDGHHVETASDSSLTWEVFKPGKYDLVVTDFEMLGSRGDKLAANL
jgi:hypothetical protein